MDKDFYVKKKTFPKIDIIERKDVKRGRKNKKHVEEK